MSTQTYFTKYFILFSFFAFSFLSCNQIQKPEKPEKLNCQTVKNLIEQDQHLRNKHRNILSPTFHLMDSLLKEEGYEKGIDNMSEVDHNDLQTIRTQVEKMEKNLVIDQKKVDSIWVLQNKIDRDNTTRLIEILDNMNEAETKSMPYECGRESLIVFVHSPDSLKEEVAKIIQKIGLKEIDEAQFNHISWHLKGRE